MRAKKKMTRPEFVCWVQEVVDKAYGGSPKRAADQWGILPAELSEILGNRRKPSKKLLAAIGYKEKKTVSYERVV